MKIPKSARGMWQRTGFVLVALGFSFHASPAGVALGQQRPATGQIAGKPLEPDSSKTLPNGVELRHSGMLLQVVALRDDVLRIRLAAKGELPPDESWAVPTGIRQQHVDVTPDATADTAGFRTKALRVRIERATLRLSITDLQGNVLQEDAEGWPAEFHADSFRVFKKMPPDEH